MQKLEVTRIDTVILCILDNNVYYAVAENGDVTPAKKDKNGVYHMEGNLTLSSKSAQNVLFTTIKPLLEAARGRNVIVTAPLPRFLTGGCCEDPAHMPNRRQAGFEANLVRDLRDTAENLRDFLFTSGFKQYKVLDPGVSWRNRDNDYLWGVDPVHPSDAAYSLLADGALHICNIMESGARKRARTSSTETGVPGPSAALIRQQGSRGARSGAGGGAGDGHRGGPQGGSRGGGARDGRRGAYGQRRGN
jgi:hypothetical protein